MKQLNIFCQECHSTGTIVHMAVDGVYYGHIVISDIVKENSQKAIHALKRTGIKKTTMLTGDSKRAAAQVAKALDMDEYYAELLPSDKVEKVEELLVKSPKRKNLPLSVTV